MYFYFLSSTCFFFGFYFQNTQYHPKSSIAFQETQKKAHLKLEESATTSIALELVKALDDGKLLQEANEYIEKRKQEGSIYEIRSDSWLNWGEKKSAPQNYPKLDAIEKEVEEFLNA